MSFLDVLLHALANLRRQKLRTALTGMGVGLGVATITIMVSFGAGVRIMVANQFDRSELFTQITVYPAPLPSVTAFSDFRRFAMQRRHSDQPMNDETLKRFREMPGVVTSYANIDGFLTVECGGRIEPLVPTRGLPVDALEGYREPSVLLVGRYWEKDDERVCVIPSALLDSYGFADAREALGKRVTFVKFGEELSHYRFEPPLDEREKTGPDGRPIPRRAVRIDPEKELATLEVAGVYDTTQLGILGGAVHVPMETARTLAKVMGLRQTSGNYRTITVKVKDRHLLAEVRERINVLGYGTFLFSDLMSVINVFFALVEAGLAFFGGIGLFVACFGIANTMLMAVFERTREIGVLKALGGRDRDVRRAFLFEAGAIGLGGGVAGVAVGYGVGALLNAATPWAVSVMMGAPPAQKALALFYTPSWLAVGAVAFATCVACLSGLYPAWRAARLDPVEALRRE